jgi:hypothetical protein
LSGVPGGAVPASQWQAARANAAQAPAQGGVLMCRRPAIAVNWRQHDFGRILHGSTPLPQPLLITSTGPAPLTIHSVTGVGAEFGVDPPGVTTLPTGASTNATVRFTPTGFGVKNAQVRISSNAGNEPAITVTVTGRLYTTLKLVFVDEPGGAARADVNFKMHQAGQPQQQGDSDAEGRIAIETELDGAFSFDAASHAEVLEFHALESA